VTPPEIRDHGSRLQFQALDLSVAKVLFGNPKRSDRKAAAKNEAPVSSLWNRGFLYNVASHRTSEDALGEASDGTVDSACSAS